MKSYTIFITKSQKAAKVISDGFRHYVDLNPKLKDYNIISGNTCANSEVCDFIPNCYKSSSTYYAAFVIDNAQKEEYELIVC